MNYTTNYHLPQWVETDRIQMEDFNQAMADIDEGLSETYGPERKAYVSGEVTIYGDTPTGTLVTFDFEPSFVVVHGGSPALILQGESGRISAALWKSTSAIQQAVSGHVRCITKLCRISMNRETPAGKSRGGLFCVMEIREQHHQQQH